MYYGAKCAISYCSWMGCNSSFPTCQQGFISFKTREYWKCKRRTSVGQACAQSQGAPAGSVSRSCTVPVSVRADGDDVLAVGGTLLEVPSALNPTTLTQPAASRSSASNSPIPAGKIMATSSPIRPAVVECREAILIAVHLFAQPGRGGGDGVFTYYLSRASTLCYAE